MTTALAPAELLGHFRPGSPEWHAARAQGLGGSEIGAVLGLSSFESRFSLWHRKMGLIEPVDESPEMEWGKRLEPVILAKYTDTHPEFVTVDQGGTWRSIHEPFMVANPDLLGGRSAVEAKFSIYGDGWGPSGSDEYPPGYRCQSIWYGIVCGLEYVDLCVLIGGYDWREYRIEWDLDEAQLLIAAGREFMRTLENAEQPDIDDHTATYETIRELHPDIDPVTVDIDTPLAVEFLDSKAAVKAAEDRARLATSLLADAMGTAKTAKWDGDTIATRRAKNGGTPYVQIARNPPTTKEHTQP